MERKHHTRLARRAARRAQLTYVATSQPGIRRLRAGKGFRYVGPQGNAVRSPGVVNRIKTLAIPPAWEDVWICPNARGHLQAMGTDSRGRTQYLYHADWRQVRDQGKFSNVLAFARALPKIHRAVSRDLRRTGLPQDKVLAAVVRLLETTLIRVGNDEYARKNGAFGLTTMRDKHARVSGQRVVFDFRGKSGIRHAIEHHHPQLASIVRNCQQLPGKQLFQYLDEAGEVRDVSSNDVNDYLRRITGSEFTAKDFRTWAGTALAARLLAKGKTEKTKSAQRRAIQAAMQLVSQKLGNTPAICRKSYVHPVILDCYLDSSLQRVLGRHRSLEKGVLKLLAANT